ncbi:Cell cycle serine/threonine-protein kinase hsk1 [Smittium culicis]|uniref:non-specific serine/threonine protein kinase n=1 Tax=Smittium culicis TaxID=133412 RepID=A0A1R1XRE5_9FUNG|nr:Cell cycle serine/threonine-protein kinase hsk1 [Smittium culicis]
MGTPRVSIDSLTAPNSEPSNFEYTNSQNENTDSSSTKFEEWVNKQYKKAQNSISDEEKEEIHSLYNKFPKVKESYLLLAKIGEGTFSTVYKAIDLNHSNYDNSSWLSLIQWNASTSSGSPLNDNQLKLVAVKKIYVTSSPKRIANEISILKDLSHCDKIAPLITAMRNEDQIVIVMPYIKSEDFRSYYLNLSLDGIKFYFKSLFEALAFTHSKKIIHRDVKPSNFLYSVKKKHGVLVDFGLAERESEQEAILYERNSSSTNSGLNPNIASRIYRRFDENGNPGVPRKDTRPSIRANRAGTRGFRAPEVLFKLPNQSTSIDIWSAGVILLCFLTKRFPFFQSTDDTEALLEISVLFGKVAMEQLSFELGRNFYTNIPTVKDKGIRFDALVRTYSMESWKTDVDYSVKFDLAIDLLKKCLTLNFKNRITASEAIYHPFFE